MEKTVQKIPFLRLALALAIGIIIGDQFKIPYGITLGFLVSSLFLMVLLNRYYKYNYATLFGLSVIVFFMTLGMWIFTLYNKKPNSFTHATFQATVLEAPQEKAASYKSLLRIHYGIKNDSIFKTNQKVLVYFEKTIGVKSLQPGDNIIFDALPESMKNQGNPFEFDYKKYLERKRIYYQLYLPADKWQKVNSHTTFSLPILAEQFREKLLDIYRAQHFDKVQFNILSALTLGYKRGLDPETKNIFASAGAMHVLAVSGLHVGIIYGLLIFLLGFMKRRKAGRLLFVLITLYCLWAYAFITGLSPSVERSATMFSLLVIGENLKRRINIYNSLAASALLLLLINPNNLFEAGFQLSYAAVFGIVFLQPRLVKMFNIKNKIGRFFWVLVTVSIAAQATTFPITLYYFNQFPTYFWLSNLLVIPAVSVLIPLGLSLLLFARIPFLVHILSPLIKFIIKAVYFFLQQIEQLPFSVLHESTNTIEFIFVIGFLLSFLLLLKRPGARYIKTGLLSILLLIVAASVLKIHTLKQNEMIVYNYPKNTILHLINGKSNYVISDKKIEDDDYAIRLINTTNSKLHLEKPKYLTRADSITDSHLFFKNGVILFGKYILLFEQTPGSIPPELTPDFLINPIISNKSEWNSTKQACVILNHSFVPVNIAMQVRKYDVNKAGAFQKKW